MANVGIEVDEENYSIIVIIPIPLTIDSRTQILNYLGTKYAKELRRYRFVGHQKLCLRTKRTAEAFQVMEEYANRLSP